MATSIVMPQMGYDMQEGTVVRWHKNEGDPVARGDVIADIETDKATVEFEAYVGGVLRKIVAQEGMAIPVGELIAVITAPDEALPEGLLSGAEIAGIDGAQSGNGSTSISASPAATPASSPQVASPRREVVSRNRDYGPSFPSMDSHLYRQCAGTSTPPSLKTLEFRVFHVSPLPIPRT